MSDTDGQSSYRWYILALGTLTHAVALAMPIMCLSTMFKDIAADLDMNRVEVGAIWGLVALPLVVIGLVGGALGDRLGIRRTLSAACVLAGIAGAARGLSDSFIMLAITNLAFGLPATVIPMTVHKACGVWFSRKQLGLANGVVAMGMAFGFMAGSMISATYLSGWLGGWRNVLIFYGAGSLVLGVPWMFVRSPEVGADEREEVTSPSLKETVLHVVRIRSAWFLGVAMICINGCNQGIIGYLPYHLRSVGWDGAAADGALAVFHGVSMLCVIPVALLSNRLTCRRNALIMATLLTIFGAAILGFAQGSAVWLAVLAAGCVRDGFMAVLITIIIELRGVGGRYAGTAIGFVMSFAGIGSLVGPPLGNSMARFLPGGPFLFWMAIAVVGVALLGFVRDSRADIPGPENDNRTREIDK